MTLKEEVNRFLQDFTFKLDFWGLYLRVDRSNDKNIKTLLALEFNYTQVKKILKELKTEDYSEGPKTDQQYKISDMWVLEKSLKVRKCI